ncbi:sugar ABC transporter ATP-binding protein [Embleya scabrispora]|uniref:sugar ABC transporter ATP-binding protein n=1 Tax=Embleya scabrispora TaxID=159449 RepID=UPI00039BC390|nr:sugar ABC transporter ATP-binding protein [Embleya scabrispora]MYS80805.1 ATP-binding cassette domain-containing protein [Streptomyces sp. SID5474]
MSVGSPTPSAGGAGTHARPPLAQAVDVVKRFGPTVALDNAQLEVVPGESHALVGRNGAGKSTLVSLLTGLARPDSGRILFGGEPAPSLADRNAWRRRVACVYQKSTIIPQLTVAENVFLNRQPTGPGRFIAWRRMRTRARELLDQWGVDIPVDTPAADLSVGDRQLVEIARSLSFGARFVILDEPTAPLDRREIERLFARMRVLQAADVTFLFISHHLQEVYEVCQSVTVMRDARWITTRPVALMPRTELVEAMTGEWMPEKTAAEPRDLTGRPVRLQVSDLAGDAFSGVSLAVRQGEVLGVAGSSASGKIELAETLVGLRRVKSGTATLDDIPIPFGNVPKAIASSIACVPRDRHDQGLVAGLSVAENAALTLRSVRAGRFGTISPARERRQARRVVADLDIKTPGVEAPVSALSGGNQQKVVMARALATDPRLLVLINPTAGIDVKSKEALLGLVDDMRERRTAVVVISDELDDLRTCDRVLVLRHGCVTTEHPAGWRDNDLVAAIEGMSDEGTTHD